MSVIRPKIWEILNALYEIDSITVLDWISEELSMHAEDAPHEPAYDKSDLD